MITETILTSATTSLIKSMVDKMKPKFEDILRSARIWSEERLNQHAARFNEYLIRKYEDFSIVKTLAFRNSQRLLKDIYVAQTLVKMNSWSSNEEFFIDRFPAELIRQYKKVLIADTAGMGKSTIMKRMFIDLIEAGLEGIGIPIYIELNRLNKDRTILSEIQEDLNSLSKEFDNDLLLSLIQKGGFVFFMDGYDEIPKKDKTKVTNDLKNLITKAGSNNYFILTSREEDRLASFADFQGFNIKHLTREEAFELLWKYDLSPSKQISTKLIDLLKSGEYDSIKEYLVNPLLVTLLHIVFNFKQKIPLKKHLFYEQVYDALYESHKEAQGQNPHEKSSGLDKDDFNRVLRFMGFECLKKGIIIFEKHVILRIIRNARGFCRNLIFSESSFLDDLLVAVPLFCKEGVEYRWAHKSLMEYFAALFIAVDAKEDQDKILTNIYFSNYLNKYINMLDLYHDIDYKGFSKNITLPLCEEFVKFYDDNFKELELCDKDFNIKNISLIEERIGLLFYYDAEGTQPWGHKDKEFVYHRESIEFSRRDDSQSRFYDMAQELLSHCNAFSWSSINQTMYLVLEDFQSFFCDGIALLHLLYRKEQTLFKSSRVKIEYDETLAPVPMNCPRSFDRLDNDSKEVLSVRSGILNEKIYMLINDILSLDRIESHYLGGADRIHSLDYDACKKEIEIIENRLNPSDIADGL